jgi:hypothetical protein
MAELVPAIHVFLSQPRTWMPGTFCMKTRFALLARAHGHLTKRRP